MIYQTWMVLVHLKYLDKLTELNIFTYPIKTYKVNELVEFFDCVNPDLRYNEKILSMSIGVTEKDLHKFRTVYELTNGGIKYLCVDVLTNGYTEMFSDFIYQLRLNHSEILVIINR